VKKTKQKRDGVQKRELPDGTKRRGAVSQNDIVLGRVLPPCRGGDPEEGVTLRRTGPWPKKLLAEIKSCVLSLKVYEFGASSSRVNGAPVKTRAP